MEKLTLNLPQNHQQKENTEKLIQALKENDVLLRMFKKNQIPLSVIETSPWRIRKWLLAFKPCQGCKGLDQCAQKTKGYYYNLTYDEILDTCLTPCRYQQEKQQRLAHKNKYYISDLSEKLQAVSFAEIETDQEEEEYLEVLVKAMQASRNDQGLYLYGTMGSGKTYLAACASNEHAKDGETVAFVHYPTFCKRIAELSRTQEDKDLFSELCRAKFVVFDDIGAEVVTEWNRDSILLPILNYRYENDLVTWFTSNFDFAGLEKHFSYTNKGVVDELKAARIMERIKHMSNETALHGKDRRINKSI